MTIIIEVSGGVVTTVHDEQGKELEYTMLDWDNGVICTTCEKELAEIDPPHVFAGGGATLIICRDCMKKIEKAIKAWS